MNITLFLFLLLIFGCLFSNFVLNIFILLNKNDSCALQNKHINFKNKYILYECASGTCGGWADRVEGKFFNATQVCILNI